MTTSSPEAVAGRPSLRRARLADAAVVWGWNNHPDARAVSMNTEPIAWDIHCRWYAARLADANTEIYVVELGGAMAGTVRIEPAGGVCCAISIALAAWVRGRGVGRIAIGDACRDYSASRPEALIEAWIRSDNIASRRCFVGAGFFVQRAHEQHGHQWRVLRWCKQHREEEK